MLNPVSHCRFYNEMRSTKSTFYLLTYHHELFFNLFCEHNLKS